MGETSVTDRIPDNFTIKKRLENKINKIKTPDKSLITDIFQSQTENRLVGARSQELDLLDIINNHNPSVDLDDNVYRESDLKLISELIFMTSLDSMNIYFIMSLSCYLYFRIGFSVNCLFLINFILIILLTTRVLFHFNAAKYK